MQQGAQKLLADAMVIQEARIGPPAAATGGTGLTFPTERERAQAALTKFKAAADAYPDDGCGPVRALSGGGDAGRRWAIRPRRPRPIRSSIDGAGNRLFGQTARLGLAAAHARGGQYDQAITTYKELAQRKDGRLPIDGILMQLGRVYRDAGSAGEAQQTFNRLIEEFPESPFNADAKRELDALKKASRLSAGRSEPNRYDRIL